MEEIFPGELVFLCACDGHDDLHDYYGPPNEYFTSAQYHSRGPQPLPLYYVSGESAASRPLHHEPPLLPLLCARAGKSEGFHCISSRHDMEISAAHTNSDFERGTYFVQSLG